VVVNLLVRGRVSFHPEVLMVEETLLCPPMNQGVVAKKYPYPLVDSVAVGETLLYPLVNQVMGFVRAPVAPPRQDIGLLMLGQELRRK
jgi:hypothetical protein